MNPSTAVLGMGRMGRAVAQRLATACLPVVTWSRSGVSVAGTESAPSAREAVHRADVVVLTLYDGEACADVLDECLDAMPRGGTVLNLATVAPHEADALAALVHGADQRYLHAPVLGSIDAVAAGTLKVLLGVGAPGNETVPDGVTRLLSALGEVIAVGDPASAAALKLIANSTLAASVIGLGEALARSDRLGLDRELTLSVLEHSLWGRLVSAKRPWLAGSAPTATFTAGALAKDLQLLAAADPRGRDLVRSFAASGTADEADIAAVSAAVAAMSSQLVDPVSRLTVARDVEHDAGVLEPLVAYARGHATGDPSHFRLAFRSSARITGLRDGELVSWDLDTYCSLFSGRPAEDEQDRTRAVTSLEVNRTVASATMVLEHGRDVFSDVFLLVRADDGWRIVDKVYDRRSR